MKRRILVVGSIVAVVILILASFPSVVSVQSRKSYLQEQRYNYLKRFLIKDIDNSEWHPGYFIELLLTLIYFVIFYGIVWFLTGLYDYFHYGEWSPGAYLIDFLLQLIEYLHDMGTI